MKDRDRYPGEGLPAVSSQSQQCKICRNAMSWGFKAWAPKELMDKCNSDEDV